jgi:hypothetical protein
MSLEPKGYLKIKLWMRKHIESELKSKRTRKSYVKKGVFFFNDDNLRDVERRSTMDIGPINPEFFSLK